MRTWLEGPCLCKEGIARSFTCADAKACGFCDGCKQSRLCHMDELAPMSWYRGAIRINWVFYQFDAIAYSYEQAALLVKNKVGFDKKYGDEDFVMNCVRLLDPVETAIHEKCECRIWKDRVNRQELNLLRR